MRVISSSFLVTLIVVVAVVSSIATLSSASSSCPRGTGTCEDFPCPPSKNCVCTRVSEQFFCETVSFAEKLIESGEYTRSDLYWGSGSLVYKKGEEHKIRGLKKPIHPAAAAAVVPDAELVKSSWNQCPSTCGDSPCSSWNHCVCAHVTTRLICVSGADAEKLLKSGEYVLSKEYYGSGDLVYKKGDEHKIRGLKHSDSHAAAAVVKNEQQKDGSCSRLTCGNGNSCSDPSSCVCTCWHNEECYCGSANEARELLRTGEYISAENGAGTIVYRKDSSLNKQNKN